MKSNFKYIIGISLIDMIIIIVIKKNLFVFGFLQSCCWVSTSHLRKQKGILILFLFFFRELNFVEILLRFSILLRLLLTSKGKNIFIINMKCIKMN